MNQNMEYVHVQKNIRTSPRKLRLVADMIRKMTPQGALEILQFTNKAAALPLTKAIKTALANVGKENLTFQKIEINEGVRLFRIRAGSHTYRSPYRRRFSHIKIVLTDETINDKLQISNKKEKKGGSESQIGVADSADETGSETQNMTESAK